MKIQINEIGEVFYRIEHRNYFVGKVFYSNGWFADSCDGNGESDFFTGTPFGTKERAIEHIDQTMKKIFKRILDET